MQRMILTCLVALGIAALEPAAAAAQPKREPALGSTNFLLGRYASTGTASLYGVVGAGPAMGFAGVIRNTKTNSQVVVVGGGTRLRLHGLGGLTVLAGVADGSGGAMIRLYALPVLRFGRWKVSGVATTYLPLEAEGRWKASLDPLGLSFGVTRNVGVGLATVVRGGSGGATDIGAGPSAALRIAGTTIRTELVRMSRARRVEACLNLGVTF